MKKRSVIIGIVVIDIVVVVVLAVIALINANRTAVMDVVLVPKTAVLRIENDEFRQGVYKMFPGKVSGVISAEGFEDKIIDSKRIHDYPTSRDKIYELCVGLGKSHEDAIRIAILSKKRISEYDKYYDEWTKLVEGLPEYLIKYLFKIKYTFPLAHLINTAKIDYLEMYYKLNAHDYYEVKLGKYLKIFNKLDKEEIELLSDDLINNHNINYNNNLRLYLEYKNRA